MLSEVFLRHNRIRKIASVPFEVTAAAFLSSPGMQLEPKRLDNSQHGVKTWTTFARKRLIKTLSRQSCIARDFRHAFGSRYISERFSNERGISVSFLKAGFQISRHLLWGPEVFCNVVSRSNSFFHIN
jgi:hypothetical protein